MSNLQRILNLIRHKNVEVTVTYEEVSGGYIFRLSKKDVPIKTTVCFSVDRRCLDTQVEIDDFVYFLFAENIKQLEKLTAEIDEIE
jgi:hypothetical protein